ncbi:MAG: hypothetical protein QOH58_1856 [Thermoleophilaceae bacterium]|jgi:hypothetical protein|nr:hypothetical protein [Thermoleophilaceae bacterium]
MTRRIWPAGLGSALLLLVAASTAAASGVSLQLQGSTQPVVVTAEQLGGLADVPATRYRIRDEPGRRAAMVTRSGARLATVLRAAGVDPASVPTLEITRADGSILYLPRHEVDPASGAPPLLYVSGRSVGFVRDSTAPDDVNADDAFVSSSGTPIRITVSPSAVLTVRVRAAHTEVAPGRRVRFSAEVAGALPDEALAYEWRFGDGSTATTTEPVHRFARRGRYAVVLQVTGDRGSGGSSAPVELRVGRPEQQRRRGPEGAGRSETPGAPATGPVAGSDAGGGAQDTAPAGQPAAPKAERPRRKPRKRSHSDGDSGPGVLSGTVLAERAPAAQPPRTASAAPAAARAGAEQGEPAPGWVAGVAACLLLLALGAAGEWRAVRAQRVRALGAGR